MKTNNQTGVASLIVITVLLLATSVAIFYLNRGAISDQRRSANQYRSTTALEVADAGIEWATGMLNSSYDIDSSCNFLNTTNVSFRKKYVQTMFNDAMAPTSDVVLPAHAVYPGCTVSGTTLTCGCPDVPGSGTATAAVTNANSLPSFTVKFDYVPLPSGGNDPESVKVTSYGCIGQSGMCTSTSANSDANSTVSVILKLRPLLRAAPAAAVTCGTTCSLGGSFDVINTDPGTNGILVNSGSNSSITGGTPTSLPGQPIENATVANDSSLSTLAGGDLNCNNSAVFNAYFGSTLSQYESAPTTKTLSCGNAQDCGTATIAAYNDGWRSFYYPDGVEFNNASFSTLGSTTDPVTIVSDSQIRFTGNIAIYGLVFSNDANSNATGTGTADIYGALVTCGAFSATGNGKVQYDPTALENIRRSTGVMTRISGSWRDF